MALKIAAQYANTVAASASYPEGSFKNETAPGALDGTPLEKAWPDDIQGLLQSLLAAAGISATGNADTVLAPQYLAGIFNLRYYSRVDYNVGTRVTGSNSVVYVAIVANGPGTTIVNPVGGAAGYWITEQAARYDDDNPVGTIRMTNYTPHNFPAGTWTQTMVGRFPVGVNGSDPLWNVAGETGGAKAHNHSSGALSAAGHSLTIAQIPAHTHIAGIPTVNNQSGQSGPALESNLQQASVPFDVTTSSAGSGGAHAHTISGNTATQDNIPPYEAAFYWRRTS
jgi:hypothetical protein